MKVTSALLFAFALLVFSACGDDDDQIDAGGGGSTTDNGSDEAPAAGGPFGDTIWQLSAGSIDGSALMLIDTHPITLIGTPEGIGGTAACNSYGGTVTVDGDTIAISELFQTEMACFPEATMTLEAAYLAALTRATKVSANGGSLTLTGATVDLVFAAQEPVVDAELTGTAWLLDSVIDGESVSSTVAGAEAPLTIADDGTLNGSTGCNQINATIVFDDSAWAQADVAGTTMACEPERMAQETAVLRVLSGAPTWSIEGDTLTLLLADGTGLVYRAR